MIKDTSVLILGLLVVAVLSLYIDTSVTLAICSGLVGYLVPKHAKHAEDENEGQ